MAKVELDKVKGQIEELEELQLRLKSLTKIKQIQQSQGIHAVDEYARGLLNGLICAESIMLDKDPEYVKLEEPQKEAPPPTHA